MLHGKGTAALLKIAVQQSLFMQSIGAVSDFGLYPIPVWRSDRCHHRPAVPPLTGAVQESGQYILWKNWRYLSRNNINWDCHEFFSIKSPPSGSCADMDGIGDNLYLHSSVNRVLQSIFHTALVCGICCFLCKMKGVIQKDD